jgi:hypothetical protein
MAWNIPEVPSPDPDPQIELELWHCGKFRPVDMFPWTCPKCKTTLTFEGVLDPKNSTVAYVCPRRA